MSQERDNPGEESRKRQRHYEARQDFGDIQTSEDNPWLFSADELKETPSRLHNIPEQIEARIVAKTAQFIQECGRELGVPQLTVSVAIKFFQRFFMLESMLIHKPPIVAAACLFLSCKVQETHKRLRDVIFWTVKVRTRNTPDYPDGMSLSENSHHFYEEKNSILDKEREVLRVLNFDLTVDHPYKHLITLTRSYLGTSEVQKAVTQAAWNFVNDSFRTYIHVQYDPKEIATATMFLSAQLHGYQLPDGTQRDAATNNRLLAWHELFRTDVTRIEEICNKILDMYEIEEESKAEKIFSEGCGVIESLPESHPARRQKISESAT